MIKGFYSSDLSIWALPPPQGIFPGHFKEFWGFFPLPEFCCAHKHVGTAAGCCCFNLSLSANTAHPPFFLIGIPIFGLRILRNPFGEALLRGRAALGGTRAPNFAFHPPELHETLRKTHQHRSSGVSPGIRKFCLFFFTFRPTRRRQCPRHRLLWVSGFFLHWV